MSNKSKSNNFRNQENINLAKYKLVIFFRLECINNPSCPVTQRQKTYYGYRTLAHQVQLSRLKDIARKYSKYILSATIYDTQTDKPVFQQHYNASKDCLNQII